MPPKNTTKCKQSDDNILFITPLNAFFLSPARSRFDGIVLYFDATKNEASFMVTFLFFDGKKQKINQLRKKKSHKRSELKSQSKTEFGAQYFISIFLRVTRLIGFQSDISIKCSFLCRTQCRIIVSNHFFTNKIRSHVCFDNWSNCLKMQKQWVYLIRST